MSEGTVTVRMFGRLHTLRRERGLPEAADLPLGAEGTTARQLALRLDLPLDQIEAVFVNHRAVDLGHAVKPGDAVAFVPQGTPGPHRFTLGIHEAGVKSRKS